MSIDAPVELSVVFALQDHAADPAKNGNHAEDKGHAGYNAAPLS